MLPATWRTIKCSLPPRVAKRARRARLFRSGSARGAAARSRVPFGNHAGLARRGAVGGIDAKQRRPDQILAAEKQRQVSALPGRNIGFLEKILERTPRPARIE